MMYQTDKGDITLTLTQLQFAILLHGIDMSECNSEEFLNIRNMLCDIYDRIK